MLSGLEIGAGDIACTDVAASNVKVAPAINLNIMLLRFLFGADC
jgi:hypothetical protein